MTELTVLSVIGTRPEAIKMAPVLRELARHHPAVRAITCLTGQHRQMIEPLLAAFEIRPDYDLQVMQEAHTLSRLTAALLEKLDPILSGTKPDWVLAQGDTTSVMAAGLAAFYHRIPFGHVEAGLRTGDKFAPFPEELNRRIADLTADAWFAPTPRARDCLLREGCDPARVHLTGNTVVDSLLWIGSRPHGWEGGPFPFLAGTDRLVLVTAHRRESFGPPLEAVWTAVRDLAIAYRDEGVRFICPVHLNPEAARPVRTLMRGLDNVLLVEPLAYGLMVQVMKRASLILTDSGGIQEEAPTFGVPVLVLRDTTERPEGVEAGLARLVGTDRNRIIAAARQLLDQPASARKAAAGNNPYGDGQAAARIVAVLRANGRSGRENPAVPSRLPQGSGSGHAGKAHEKSGLGRAPDVP